MAAHDNKDAAIGAAMGAAAAFMVTSGIGQELTLDENTKLELVLERALRLKRA
jgi:predicted small secreted protein